MYLNTIHLIFLHLTPDNLYENPYYLAILILLIYQTLPEKIIGRGSASDISAG